MTDPVPRQEAAIVAAVARAPRQDARPEAARPRRAPHMGVVGLVERVAPALHVAREAAIVHRESRIAALLAVEHARCRASGACLDRFLETLDRRRTA